MTRADIVQALLNLFEAPSYLEIGVDNGYTFNKVTAQNKRAVDPVFKFQPQDVAHGDRTIRHFSVTSDVYFESQGANWPIDVAFVDGLHTFEQTLRDLLNVQANLKAHGVIVVDDINPISYHASLPDPSEAFRVRDHQARLYPQMIDDHSWMGDVYKLIFFVRDFMQSWNYACVAESRGQLVLWRQPRAAADVGTRSYAAIEATSFREVVSCQAEFRFQPMAEILAQVAANAAVHGNNVLCR
jgi:hypothetical protein